ncbi:A24 family peptidase [Nevskia soli]|uniref:A24 family peptidase n=1 Tax=Nevskia soli TaxID=418856 RepID=UPI0015D6F3A6|nr:prepilin peptidase [Nevskia soli]
MHVAALTLRFFLVAVALLAGWFDFRSRRIPNWITVSGVLLGFGLNTSFFGFAGALSAAEGLALALIVYIPLYILRGMGAGDVKLMAALAAMAGPTNWLIIFLVTSLLGGVAALVLVLARKRFAQTWFNVLTLVGSLARFEAPYRTNIELDVRESQSLRLPHGTVIAFGAALCLLAGLFPN